MSLDDTFRQELFDSLSIEQIRGQMKVPLKLGKSCPKCFFLQKKHAPLLYNSQLCRFSHTSGQIPISFCPSPAFSMIPDVLRSSSNTPSFSDPPWVLLSETRNFFASEKTRQPTSNHCAKKRSLNLS